MKLPLFCKHLLIALTIALFIPLSTSAYSILTHEAIIDASWEKSIQPLLKRKFPQATEADLKVGSFLCLWRQFNRLI